ncbi:metalloregulator ArsR/SmtB family transcription factor [Burkholderia vietnamiensis]|uniref:Metalloregulator ArsR/SmtB family transcription factor n=1 Tax=Burkholderia vietnamiensis TaxID=60552 RepID=A0AAW7SYR5_BURVI|nr:metalloregulator ArsR/SmtB family transcription factor [Burkholderia vietnamiensis]MBH9645842.1 helix-turn-helix transcriptional regulator [Burkholderia vietnamiensis]MBR8008849.1 helix-turn-helix transcriptional regulator [Burkholderia vietnamiensis]MDN7551293.1 metalloregulator ArsR/SmtB family transcription factor [Burkholderia vietnamiensis]MDN7795107.1 metalloregulator ArsR/SmtB family transcription factor [Burkholderia vietnamiensis]MDN8043619.1 metalloregulator ArsR/SmtB family trans
MVELVEQFKALSSEVRLQILEWLKQPEGNFPPTHAPNGWAEGVCVTHIQQKVEMSPSTVSTHLSILQRAGLVETSRVGQWTYYRRNEKAITLLAQRIGKDL